MECDSFVLNIKSNDLADDQAKLRQKRQFLISTTFKRNIRCKVPKVIQKFKIETPDTLTKKEFVALRAKTFIYLRWIWKEDKKAKGQCQITEEKILEGI